MSNQTSNTENLTDEELKKFEALHKIKNECPEKLPYAVCGQSYAGHCVACPSEYDTEDQK